MMTISNKAQIRIFSVLLVWFAANIGFDIGQGWWYWMFFDTLMLAWTYMFLIVERNKKEDENE